MDVSGTVPEASAALRNNLAPVCCLLVFFPNPPNYPLSAQRLLQLPKDVGTGFADVFLCALSAVFLLTRPIK